jgi:DegV family protein with EDD domain
MIKIVSDTLTCIPPDEAKQLGIAYLPQIIIFGEDSYRDDYEITHEEFLQKLVSARTLPSTSAPSPDLYYPIYEEAIRNNDTLIVILPSDKMSGTMRSATVAAKEYEDLKIHFFDTGILAPAQGVMVRCALKWAQDGLDVSAILAKLSTMKERQTSYFVVDTLEYLYRGGRIGAAKALFGSVLQIKPILGIEDGGIVPVESQRTTKKAVNRLVELVEQQYPRDREGFLTLSHADAREKVENIAEELKRKLNISDIPIYNLPPAIMVHAGPGVVAAQFFK